jgi:hypothetical protein
MTKPFDNVSSILGVSVFEASTKGTAATSYWVKALGSWFSAVGSKPLRRRGFLRFLESADSILKNSFHIHI